MTRPTDNINPQHYRQYPVEAIEVIEEMTNPLLANCVKYCWRLGDKGDPGKTKEDREKALWYFDRWVDKRSIWQKQNFVDKFGARSIVTDMLRDDANPRRDGNARDFFRDLFDAERKALRYVEKALDPDYSSQVGRLLMLKDHMPAKRLHTIRNLVALDANLRIDLDHGVWTLAVTPGPEVLTIIRDGIEKL